MIYSRSLLWSKFTLVVWPKIEGIIGFWQLRTLRTGSSTYSESDLHSSYITESESDLSFSFSFNATIPESI